MFQAKDVEELRKRQQHLARQIVVNMDKGKGPFGIVADRVEGQGVLRKVLPMLWELPMASASEYNGVCWLAGEETAALSSVPAGADRLVLYP